MTMIIDDFFILLLWIILILTAVSTVWELYSKEINIQQPEALLAFSISKNMKQLVKINESKSVIKSIDAIKVIAAFWVVVGHRAISANTASRFGIFFLQFKAQNQLSVDTFLACSGILVCQSFLRSFERNEYNIFKVYINRFYRYFPSIAVILMFTMSSLPSEFTDNIEVFAHTKQVCSLSWKSTLFLTQNLNADLNGNCIQHLWYLALDFQLFLLSPFFVFLLKKFGNKGILATVALICVICYQLYNRFAFTGITWYEQYVSTHYRLPEYLVGIIFGYLIHNSKNTQPLTKKNLILSYVGWIFALGFIYNHFWGLLPSYIPQSGQIVFGASSRALWSLSVCYVIFACHQHQTGGIIRWFLSLNFWQPLSKIGLSIYIVHALYLFATSGQLPQKSAFGMWWNFTIHVNDFIASIVIGACLYLLVEAPTVKLLNYLWSNNRKVRFDDKNVNLHSSFEIKRVLGYFRVAKVVEMYKELK